MGSGNGCISPWVLARATFPHGLGYWQWLYCLMGYGNMDQRLHCPFGPWHWLHGPWTLAMTILFTVSHESWQHESMTTLSHVNWQWLHCHMGTGNGYIVPWELAMATLSHESWQWLHGLMGPGLHRSLPWSMVTGSHGSLES